MSAPLWPYSLADAWVSAGYVEQFSAKADSKGAVSQMAFAQVDGYRVGNWVFLSVSPLLPASAAVASAPISLEAVLPTDYLPQGGMVVPAVVMDSKTAGGTIGLNSNGSMTLMPYSGAFTLGAPAGLVSSAWFAYLLQPPPPMALGNKSATLLPAAATPSDADYEKI